MVNLTEYKETLDENNECDGYEEKTTRIKRSDLKDATIDEFSMGCGPQLLVTLKDGRKIHIMPASDGENFEFCLWTHEQTAGVS